MPQWVSNFFMEEIYEDYRSFDSMETARFVLLDVLEKNNIPYVIYEDKIRQDVILGRGSNFAEVWIRIKPADFAKVNQLFLEDAIKRNEVVPEDYYLREMSDTELLDILKKQDEWSIDDYVIALKILREHGIEIKDEVLAEWKKERKEELRMLKRKELAGEQINTDAFLKRGYHISNASLVDHDTGRREYVFDEKERRRGRWSRYLGLAIFFGLIIYVIIRRMAAL